MLTRFAGTRGAQRAYLSALEPERTAALRARLDAGFGRAPATGAVRPEVRIDPALAERLRALAYAL